MGAGHSHDTKSSRIWPLIAFTAVIGALLLANVAGWLRTIGGYNTAIFLTLIGGYRIFYEAIRGILKRDINAAVAVALAAIGALWIEQYAAAAEVVFIMLVGECLETFAVRRTRSAIRALLALAPPVARVRRDGEEAVLPIDLVRPGDLAIVRPGERIPVDGAVEAGRSSVDQSAMTGESMPAGKEPGDLVLAGTVNGPGALEIRVHAAGHDTKLSEIIHLVEEAEHSRAPAQRRVDRYAKWFVPIVIVIAAATFLIARKMGVTLEASIIRGVSVLIVACPCALVLATPTAIAAGLGRLAMSGILVKGGAWLEAIGQADCVVFDKTGTLTLGQPRIVHIAPFGQTAEPRGGAGASMHENDLLRIAAAAEQRSEHLLGQLIVEEARARNLALEADNSAQDFMAHPGFGVEARIGGERILAGGRKWLEREQIEFPSGAAAILESFDRQGLTVIVVAQGGRAIGAIAAEDAIRPQARGAVAALREAGIERMAMLTGDNARAAERVARQAGIEETLADLLPADKVAAIQRLQREGRKVLMLGDGINDAPSLAAADVGVAMGGIGSDIAMEAADVVIMTDDPSRLAEAVYVSRRVLRMIHANILWFAFGFNTLGVAAAAGGWASPVAAAVLHQISSLLVCLNSLRLLFAGRFHETWLGRAIRRAQRLVHEGIPAALAWTWRRRGRLSLAAALGLAALYTLGGLYAIRPGEAGVERRFGRIVRQAPPGLHYRLPWPWGRVDRVAVDLTRTMEIGFRTGLPAAAEPSGVAATTTTPAGNEPAAYEWNTRHTIGRYEKNMDEAVMLTGDENLVEATLVAHYRVSDAALFLASASDAEGLLRACAESAVRSAIAERPLMDALAADRRAIEQLALQRLRAGIGEFHLGVELLEVRLQDIHPPLETVENFRAVSSAFEEKHRLVNEAEAYAAERKELAQGEAAQLREAAQAYSVEKVSRAQGEAGKFDMLSAAFAKAGPVAALRQYLETVQTALAPLRKIIIDSPTAPGQAQARAHLYLYDESAFKPILDALAAQAAAPPAYYPLPNPDSMD